MTTQPGSGSAEIEVLRARERFMHTLNQLQRRLNPAVLAGGLAETVKERASDATGRSVAAVKARPVAAAAVAIPLVGWLFRRPLARLINAALDRGDPEPTLIPPFDTPPADAG